MTLKDQIESQNKKEEDRIKKDIEGILSKWHIPVESVSKSGDGFYSIKIPFLEGDDERSIPMDVIDEIRKSQNIKLLVADYTGFAIVIYRREM